MNTRVTKSVALVVAVCLLTGTPGCVSAKYKRADKFTPPVQLNLRNQDPALEVVLQSVIVYGGPGSWKREAFWDEYGLLFLNHGPVPLEVESITVVDLLDAPQRPGTNPWDLEKLSRKNLRNYERYAGRIAAGVSIGVLWGASPAVAIGGAYAGSSAAALAGTVTFFALPAIVVTSILISSHAKHDIAAEFDRRRLLFPLELGPGSVRQGSVFFPISPGPKRLIIAGIAGEKGFTTEIDLAPLAGLHLSRRKAAGTAP